MFLLNLVTIKRPVMNKPFRWLIIEYAQKKVDAKHWLTHMLPALMSTNQYRHVEIDLIYCPASARPERAKWGRGMHSWIFYQFRPRLKDPLTHNVPRQSFLRLLHATLKDKTRKYYDGFMYGGHSNGEKIGRRPIRLATIQQFGRFLQRHKYYFPVIAFDSCDMGNELVIKQIRHSCEYLLAFPSDAPARSILETASFYKNPPSGNLYDYLRHIAIDYMKHIRPKMKYLRVLFVLFQFRLHYCVDYFYARVSETKIDRALQYVQRISQLS